MPAPTTDAYVTAGWDLRARLGCRRGSAGGLYVYATTGRAAIWLSPALYSAAIALSPATGTAARTSWGILGILVVILAGLTVVLPVKPAAAGVMEDGAIAQVPQASSATLDVRQDP